MLKRDEAGAGNSLLFVVIILSFMLVGSLFFGVWAFQGRQDYKNNVDQKISAAVTLAKQQVSTSKDKEFAEKEKEPLVTYKGPASYGSLTVHYPKTWSGYVDAAGSGGSPLEAYFHPNIVPSVNNQDTAFALRIQVIAQGYDEAAAEFDSAGDERNIKVTPYALPKVSAAIGVRVTGKIVDEKQGIMVLLPLRDKTLKIWTEGTEHTSDFEKHILPNLTFLP